MKLKALAVIAALSCSSALAEELSEKDLDKITAGYVESLLEMQYGHETWFDVPMSYYNQLMYPDIDPWITEDTRKLFDYAPAEPAARHWDYTQQPWYVPNHPIPEVAPNGDRFIPESNYWM